MISRRGFLGAAAGAAALAQTRRSPERLRGLMLDAARMPESIAHYRRVIDFCGEWGYNSILFRLTDDQGCSVRFESHPELVTHANALTPREASDLFAYGKQRGVMLIPEIESFGHTRFITNVPKYASLEDGDPSKRGMGGICPVHPDAVQIVHDLYKESVRLFPAPYFHGGCDEVNWGFSERSRQAIASKSRGAVWAEYVNSLGELARSLGKEFIIWGDVVAHKEPDILPLIDKRIIVMDWQYYVPEADPLRKTARGLIDDRRRVMGAPAMISCKWGPRCADVQLRNIDAFADAYAGLPDAGNLGIVITNWIPPRYLARSMWDTYAYGAVALKQGSAAARTAAFRDFASRFYGVKNAASWQEMLASYYNLTPARPSCAAGWKGAVLPAPWTTDAELRAAVAAKPGIVPDLAPFRKKLAEAEGAVRKNHEDFSSYALSAEYIEHVYWRHKPAAGTIAAIVDRDRTILAKLEKEWDSSRPAGSPGKTQTLTYLGPQDQLLYRMRESAKFASELAKDPSRLHASLRTPLANDVAQTSVCSVDTRVDASSPR
jgi:hypothetical protein